MARINELSEGGTKRRNSESLNGLVIQLLIIARAEGTHYWLYPNSRAAILFLPRYRVWNAEDAVRPKLLC